MAGNDPRAIPAQAYGRYNRVVQYNDPGVRGFLSQQIGESEPTYITQAVGIDGPYSAKNRESVSYGNVDWRGTVGGVFRIITWSGPTWRYTNGFPTFGNPIVVGDTPEPIYERGRKIATAPLPIAGAALKSIAGVVWIRVVCWQPSVEDWVCYEKIQDSEVDNSTNWDEVGRRAWDTVSDTPADAEELRRENQFEMFAAFNSTAEKAISCWVGRFTLSPAPISPTQPMLGTFLIDFDWPSSSGGPVVISDVPAQTVDRINVVGDDTPGSINYVQSISGTPVVARDFDENDDEVQFTINASGSVTATQVIVSMVETLTVTVTNQVLMDDGNGHTLRANGTRPQTGSRVNDLGGGGPQSASGQSFGYRASVAGFDLRSKFFSGYEEEEERNFGPYVSGALMPQTIDKNFDHTSFFASSLGTINHVSDARPQIVTTQAFATYLTVFYFGVPPPGTHFETATSWLPRHAITGRVGTGGVFRDSLSEGNFHDYQFDPFGNDFVFAEHATHIYFTAPDGFTILNPAAPPEMLLSGDDFQTLHGVSFNTDQVGIA